MQVTPDWSWHSKTARDLEQELIGFKFEGPGFYLSKTDTLLIVPEEPIPTNKWTKKRADDALFSLHVYSCRFEHTIFSQVAIAPNRKDDR